MEEPQKRRVTSVSSRVHGAPFPQELQLATSQSRLLANGVQTAQMEAELSGERIDGCRSRAIMDTVMVGGLPRGLLQNKKGWRSK